MEIVGIGTDIVECVRIGRMIEQHAEVFLQRVYTAREVRYCQARKHTTEHFAGYWAAKEAVLKSLGTSWRKGITWTDLEIRHTPSGIAHVQFCGAIKDHVQHLRISNILLSIAHCRTHATAYAIAISGSMPPEPLEERD